MKMIDLFVCFCVFQGQEYAEQYLLEYQRVEGGQWIRFRNRRGQEVRNRASYWQIQTLETEPPTGKHRH